MAIKKKYKRTDIIKTIIGKICIVNEQKTKIPWAVINENGNVKTDQDSVLKTWEEDFQTLFINDDMTQTDTFDQYTFNRHTDVSNLNEGITKEQMKVAIAHAKNRKAVGNDEISAEVLKNEVAIKLLYITISGCFELGHVPKQWTNGMINPILKPGMNDNRYPLNYR
ncbi:unnamed protein product [Mytilus coruscus]|uniref:Reverse transcriptase domain-containing protein n=1 Tax=Mytilus coruscus TaxID=42192 RepID=A0A6J8AMX7_MYTCO|nr:unnamed protein product [Mytilus coruscus]